MKMKKTKIDEVNEENEKKTNKDMTTKILIEMLSYNWKKFKIQN